MYNMYGAAPDYSHPNLGYNLFSPAPAKQEIVKVNGKPGAEAYAMSPNSSILLLDISAPIIWLKIIDGAGYPTLTPYTITPYTQQTVEDKLGQTVSKLDERISRLQEEIQYDKQQSDASKPDKKYIITKATNK